MRFGVRWGVRTTKPSSRSVLPSSAQPSLASCLLLPVPLVRLRFMSSRNLEIGDAPPPPPRRRRSSSLRRPKELTRSASLRSFVLFVQVHCFTASGSIFEFALAARAQILCRSRGAAEEHPDCLAQNAGGRAGERAKRAVKTLQNAKGEQPQRRRRRRRYLLAEGWRR